MDNLKEWRSLYKPRFLSESKFLPHNPFTPNTTIVSATVEWRVTVFCNFDFSHFPLDNQHCEVRMGYIVWGDLKKILYDPENTRHSAKQYEASGFDMTIAFVGNTLAQENFTNKFRFDIEMKRQIEPYLYQYYLPCIAIVLVSFISFIIPLAAIPGRVALVVTQFLTLTNIFIHQMVSDILPNVPVHLIHHLII